MAFFLFWLISLPAIWFPIHKMYGGLFYFFPLIRTNSSSSRHLFSLKAIVAPIAGIIFFIWCIVKARGVGPIVRQPAKVQGSELAWAMISSLMSCISNMATLATYALTQKFLSITHPHTYAAEMPLILLRVPITLLLPCGHN